MQTRIEVADAEEAAQIRAGLEETDVRAFVRIVGVLRNLPTDRARKRTLDFVADVVAEKARQEW